MEKSGKGKSAREQLLELKGKTVFYDGDVMEIMNMALDCGEYGDEVELYTNTGRTIVFKEYRIPSVLEKMKPVNNAVTRIVDNRLKAVSVMNPDTIGELKRILMDSILEVKQDPSKAKEVKNVINGVNAMLNLAKTELEYAKFVHTINSKM